MELDEPARERLLEIYRRSVDALDGLVAVGLRQEAEQLGIGRVPAHGQLPTTSELRILQAQLVGWLRGLSGGVGASLVSQPLARQERRGRLQGDGDRGGSEPEGGPLSRSYL